MKLLFDQNISRKIIDQISNAFPNSVHVCESGLWNSSDHEIWQFAKDNDYTIVTFDADFYDLSLVWGSPPKIIWIRRFDQSTKTIARLIETHTQNIQDFLGKSDLSCLEIIGG